tara:strand:- start:178 stop:354 length:177 start_codon:yes stop_codon:yes gene_type:complete
MGLPENPDTGFGCSKGITLSASISTFWFVTWEEINLPAQDFGETTLQDFIQEILRIAL